LAAERVGAGLGCVAADQHKDEAIGRLRRDDNGTLETAGVVVGGRASCRCTGAAEGQARVVAGANTGVKVTGLPSRDQHAIPVHTRAESVSQPVSLNTVLS
jgi:hypothetical protein